MRSSRCKTSLKRNPKVRCHCQSREYFSLETNCPKMLILPGNHFISSRRVSFQTSPLSTLFTSFYRKNLHYDGRLLFFSDMALLNLTHFLLSSECHNLPASFHGCLVLKSCLQFCCILWQPKHAATPPFEIDT